MEPLTDLGPGIRFESVFWFSSPLLWALITSSPSRLPGSLGTQQPALSVLFTWSPVSIYDDSSLASSALLLITPVHLDNLCLLFPKYCSAFEASSCDILLPSGHLLPFYLVPSLEPSVRRPLLEMFYPRNPKPFPGLYFPSTHQNPEGISLTTRAKPLLLPNFNFCHSFSVSFNGFLLLLNQNFYELTATPQVVNPILLPRSLFITF